MVKQLIHNSMGPVLGMMMGIYLGTFGLSIKVVVRNDTVLMYSS